MNLRTTAWLFAVMLSMLWLFGLMLAFKKNPLDKAYVVPSLQAARDVAIDSVTVERKPDKKEPQQFHFVQENDVWRLHDPQSNLSVKVEGFRVNQIVSQIKTARKDDEADVTNNLASFGLDNPRATIILKGRIKKKAAAEEDKDEDKKGDKKTEEPGKEKEWRFYIGKDSPDKRYVYVNSSDEKERVFAVPRSSLDALFFEDPNHLRSKRLFDFSDATAQLIEIKRGGQELELKREDSQWRFVKPDLGLADFEGPPPPKELPPPGAKAPEGGVKGLLAAIQNVRVDADADFVPLAKDNLTRYRLEDGKEAMRIEVGTPNDKKEMNKETLLVGEEEKGYYYARLAGDQGVFKLPAKQLEPVLTALKTPGQLRSIDVTTIDPKQVDAVVIKRGGEETRLWHPDARPWQVQIGTKEAKKANEMAIAKLLDTLQGKRLIQRFYDDGDAKKLDAELGFDSPSVEIALYTGGLDKQEETKDAKQEGKKDAKKDDKEAKKDEKKESKKDDGFALKKDAKPAVTLKFGKADKDAVPVLRLNADGLTTRFAVPKSVFEVAAPAEGALAYLDPALPPFDVAEIARLELDRGGKKVELEKGTGNQAGRWIAKESKDAAGQNLADTAKVEMVARMLGHLTARKYVKRLDAKDNLEEYGLKAPSLTATVQLRRVSPAGAASALGMLTVPFELRGFVAAAALAANQEDKGQAITIAFGKETADQGVYARHSGSDLLFTVPGDMVRMLREDLRDKTLLLAVEHAVAAGLAGPPAALPLAGIQGASPLATCTITDVDPAKVKEVRLAVRGDYELRNFTFVKKDKSWIDQSGLMDFTLDSDKVQQFVDNMSRFRGDRWIALGGGPKTDHKLDAKSFRVKIDLVTDAGRSYTITVGATLDRFGHFGHASHWPEAVFLVQGSRVEPLLRGVGWFAKERVALGP